MKMQMQSSLVIELCVCWCSDHISRTTEQHGAELQIKSLLHVKPAQLMLLPETKITGFLMPAWKKWNGRINISSPTWGMDKI